MSQDETRNIANNVIQESKFLMLVKMANGDVVVRTSPRSQTRHGSANVCASLPQPIVRNIYGLLLNRLIVGPHRADEIRRWHLILVASPGEPPCRKIEMEDTDAVRVLVRCNEPLARAVELEVPWGGTAGVLDASQRKMAPLCSAVVHAED